MASQIHWHEGLHLQAHHFQQSQKLLLDSLIAERELSLAYPYGVIQAELTDELKNLKVQFTRLRLIMKESRVAIDYPDDAELDHLEISKEFEELENPGEHLDIYIAVPLWQEKRRNAPPIQAVKTGEASPANLIYRLEEESCPDENTGRNERAIHKRRINARLFVNPTKVELAGMESMRLLRIFRGEGSLPAYSFSGPALFLRGAPELYEIARDIAVRLAASRAELVSQLRKGEQVDITRSSKELELVLNLRVINRFSARLPSLLKAPNISAFAAYLELRELFGELEALRLDREFIDVREIEPYEHDDPLPFFRRLHELIRELLPGGVAPAYFRVPFRSGVDRFEADFEEYHISQSQEFFVGVTSNRSREDIVRMVESGERFRLIPRGWEDHMEGVPLKFRRARVPEFPEEAGLNYFEIQWSRSLYAPRAEEEFAKKRAMSIVSPAARDAGCEISMYMTLTYQAKRDRQKLEALKAV